tara:strand:+ start:375 stop:1100 length:726 start_codon:yes stop_codon:yes gene_type:complete
MFNLNALKSIGFSLYLFIYLIFPYSAITQTSKVDLRRNLENALNSRDLSYFKEIFADDSSLIIPAKFSKFFKEFPETKWNIKRLKSKNPYENIFQIKVIGKKIIGGEIYILESNFDYLFSLLDGKISEGNIKNLFTTVRNDNKKIDITFNIPDQVLTGTKYDIDIILDKPLEEVIVAGGIKPHQVDSLLKQEIAIEPLVSGGIFKITRAPSKPGTQIWSGIIAHPKGIITFTKSIEIVEII